MNNHILSVKNLIIHYETDNGIVEAVNDISFTLEKGKTLGLVGETGAGKTSTALGIMQLLPKPAGKRISGEILLDGEDLGKKSPGEIRQIQGKEIAMIFQDPMTSLNPVMTVGAQIAEVIRIHQKCPADQAALQAREMLKKVGIAPDRFSEYPHQFSGGMRQRVIIAIALACNPRLLIADEPTTALDVTIQAQVIDLIKSLKEDFDTSMLLITHDLGVVSETCDHVAIIYAGQIVEYGDLEQIFENACHPYTIGLFGSLPSLEKDVERLQPISGLPPDPTDLPEGCSFYSRCSRRGEDCLHRDPKPQEIEAGHLVRCHRYIPAEVLV